jgi:hypothetical protein
MMMTTTTDEDQCFGPGIGMPIRIQKQLTKMKNEPDPQLKMLPKVNLVPIYNNKENLQNLLRKKSNFNVKASSDKNPNGSAVARRPLLTALSSADPYIFYSYLITQPVGSCLHKKFINKVLSLVMATRIIYRAAR